MQFNSEANNLDLYSDARYWCGISASDTTTYPLADFTRNANFGLDRAVALIQRADNVWEWDDTNQTDLPIATTTLVADQQDYGLAVTHLKLLRVRVKDAAGNYRVLPQINRRDLHDSQLTAPSGMPRGYDVLGNSIFLYPKPAASAVTTSQGLELQFQRGASYFTTSDTTKTPGFATQFHRLVSLYAALDYCNIKDLDKRAKKIEANIAKMEADLLDFYSSRDADMKVSLKPPSEDYGQLALGSDAGFSHNPDGF